MAIPNKEPLYVLYPNGKVEGSGLYVRVAGDWVPWDGALTAGSVTIGAVTISAGSALIGAVKEQGPTGTQFQIHHVPAVNTKATITQASGGGSVKNVALGFTVTLASDGTVAPAAIQLTVNLIDGASGGSTYLWRSVISLPAVQGGITSISKTGLWLPGTAATAMTLEFSAAGGGNTIESVSLQGTTTTQDL